MADEPVPSEAPPAGGPSNGPGSGRDEHGKFVPGNSAGFAPGQSGNAKGSSEKARFRAAVRRALRQRMLASDEDELDAVGREVVEIALGGSKHAVAMLKEIWAREDGPHETRIAGPNGEPLAPLVLFGVDAEAMRAGRAPEPKATDACPPTSSEAPPST